MILFISGLLLAYVCNHFDNEMKIKRRLKKAKEELFSDDRPKYTTDEIL